MNVAVIGLGYVGLVTAISLAEANNNVVAIEKDKLKLEQLKLGISPIYEPNIQEYLNKHKDRLEFVSNYKESCKEIDAIFLCVGTPKNKDNSADLSNVYEVIDEIIKNIEKDVIIVIKSTVPVGTNNNINKIINNKMKKDIKIEVVSNPEFLSQGTAIYDAINPQRIVLGTNSKRAIDAIKDIYKREDEKYILTDANTAELIKYACNSFLALRISYINEIANLCELVDADIQDVEEGMRTDKRIGKYFLKSGIGYGGSCLPKDTVALKEISEKKGYKLRTIETIIEINEKQKSKLLKKTKRYYKDLKNVNVTILGVSFKPNTDDIRESPALNNIDILLKRGAKIKVYDPIALSKLKEKYGDLIEYAANINEAIKDAELCLIFTEWEEIKKYNLINFVKYMKTPIILDGRNCYDINKIPQGIIYESIGRKTIHKT